jgi:hypothetical protein
VSPLNEFIADFQTSLADNSFRKLTLGKLRGELNGQQNVYIRLLPLKGGIRLSFVHRSLKAFRLFRIGSAKLVLPQRYSPRTREFNFNPIVAENTG